MDSASGVVEAAVRRSFAVKAKVFPIPGYPPRQLHILGHHIAAGFQRVHEIDLGICIDIRDDKHAAAFSVAVGDRAAILGLFPGGLGDVIRLRRSVTTSL